MPRRWDDDQRGHGIADARWLVAGATELLAALAEPDWVAEEPDKHLRPHVEAWCERDQRLALTEAYSDAGGAYVLEVEWQGESSGIGAARAAVFSLIGSFAESASYVRQRRVAGDAASTLRFEVGTGELSSDARFAPHGHTVVINVAGVR